MIATCFTPMSGLLEPLAKPPQAIRITVRRLAVEKPDHRHRRLLRPRRKGVRERFDKPRDEVAPFHGCYPRGQLATKVVICLGLQHPVAGCGGRRSLIILGRYVEME